MKKLFKTAILFFIGTTFTHAQGCSDAGICSIGNSFTTEKSSKNLIDLGAVYGIGDNNVTSVTGYVTYSREFSKSFAMSAKITYFSATGNDVSNSEFGDAYLIGNYKFAAQDQKQWSALVGFKIPFTSANALSDGNPLPMEYQASLGTYDVIVGTNYRMNQWDFNAGLQIPVINNNTNAYSEEVIVNGINQNSTNLLERKPDALFRTTYTYQTADKKWSFKPNVLFLYHLGEDSFENNVEDRENIKGSAGLTINGNLITSYQLNTSSSLELSLATPFLVREKRPDGLTRAFTAGLSYKVNF
ncbi:hypothetical protein [Flavobacterium sp.]